MYGLGDNNNPELRVDSNGDGTYNIKDLSKAHLQVVHQSLQGYTKKNGAVGTLAKEIVEEIKRANRKFIASEKI